MRPDAAVWGDEYLTEKVETKAGWQFPSPEEDWMRGYPQELEDFVGAISERREPLSGGLLAREVVEVIYAGYVSAATRPPRGAAAAMIPFTKGHGLGNDYIVIDEKDLRAPLSAKAIERICDRNWGVGSDGILLLVPTPRADFGLRIFNPDGSEAEKSGNGLRIFAKYLWDHGRTKKTTFTVDTKGGVVECRCRVERRAHGLRDRRDGTGDLPGARDPHERSGPRRGRRAAPARRRHHAGRHGRLGGQPALRERSSSDSTRGSAGGSGR